MLSTPGMILMMERSARLLATENLPPDRSTVGYEVNVRHVAAAGAGARCIAHARLREVDGTKLRFDVDVRDGERLIGVGTHERRVVEARSFGAAGGEG